jgi:hypothetical protein
MVNCRYLVILEFTLSKLETNDDTNINWEFYQVVRSMLYFDISPHHLVPLIYLLENPHNK